MSTHEKRLAAQNRYNRRKYGTTKESLARSKVWKGRKWEIILAKALGALDVNQNTGSHPYDLLWNGMRINVKVSEKRIGDGFVYWGFGATKRHLMSADFILCVCLSDHIPFRLFLIPSDVLPVRGGFSLGLKSRKYNKYEIKTDLFNS